MVKNKIKDFLYSLVKSKNSDSKESQESKILEEKPKSGGYCKYCKKVITPEEEYYCKYCKGYYCREHRLPERHKLSEKESCNPHELSDNS